MKRTYKVEIEAELEETDVQRAITVARAHYVEVGGAEEPIEDQSPQCRTIPPEEFLPNTVSAIVELISVNPLLERAGIDVIEVSCREVKGAGCYVPAH